MHPGNLDSNDERPRSDISPNDSLAIMRAALEAAADGMLVIADQGKIIAFNQRFVAMWQLPPELVAARDLHEVLKTCGKLLRTPDAFLEHAEQLKGGPTTQSLEIFELNDGRSFECFSRSQAVAEHAVVRVWSFRDITDRKHSERMRSHLAAIVQSSDDAIISKTLNGIVNTWNRGAEKMFGYKSEEIIGRPINILIPADQVDEEPSILERVRRGEPIEHYETRRVRKDGSMLDVSITVSPVRDDKGIIIGASKIGRDITADKRMREALQEETRMLEILNSTGTAIASRLEFKEIAQSVIDAATELSGAQVGAFFQKVVDEQGESFVLFAVSGSEQAAFEQFGLRRGARVADAPFGGRKIVRMADIATEAVQPTMPRFAVLANRPPIRSYLGLPIISRSGEEIADLVLLHTEAGIFSARSERLVAGIAAQASVAIDNARLYENQKKTADERERILDAERAARSEAERISLLKDEFLATLSHELRTPLNAILGWSEVLQSRAGGDADLQEGLEVIQRNTRVQAQLIEDLLDMSRIISGKIRLDVQHVDLQDVVKAAVASVRHSADAREIRLQVVLDPLAGPVRGDPSRLQQCCWNLLSNAIKFTPKGGKIQVGLERVNSHLEICVVDDGQGIRAEFLPHVFERFRQADASTTRRYGGLGLGLSIVKHLVELHGGSVRAKSAGEGKGSTFCIELPLMIVHTADSDGERSHPRALQGINAPPDHPDLAGVSVLVIDDEPDARDLLKRVLEECGARVFSAASAQEGLESINRELPDVIVSDIGMPGQDGYDFIRQVRLLSPEKGGHIPAAALTAFARAEDRTRALRAGYQIHVAKPVEPVELTTVVASLVANR